jgi:hypothetical protein
MLGLERESGQKGIRDRQHIVCITFPVNVAEATFVKQTISRLAPTHRHNLKEGLLEKSKLAQHAHEEGHRVVWNEARILETESNSRHRKYKELAHIACLKNLVFQVPLGLCVKSSHSVLTPLM